MSQSDEEILFDDEEEVEGKNEVEKEDEKGDDESRDEKEEKDDKVADIFGSDSESEGLSDSDKDDTENIGDERKKYFQIPTFKGPPIDTEYYIAKFPNNLAIDVNEYNEDTEVTEIPTIRWRYGEMAHGKRSIQSTAKVVRWSDDTIQLYIGNIAYDITDLPIDKQHHHLMEQKSLGTLYDMGKFTNRLKFKCVDRLSFGMNNQEKEVKTTRLTKSKVLSIEELEETKRVSHLLKQKIQKKTKRSTQKLSQSFLEDDEDSKVKSKPKKRKRKQNDDYEESDEEWEDDDATSDDDDEGAVEFYQDDDDEYEPSRKRRKL